MIATQTLWSRSLRAAALCTIAAFVALATLTTPAIAANAVEANTANEAELDSVKGLGPSSTARILQARRSAPFQDWADFMRRVKGIKAASASKLSQEGFTVNGQPYVPPASDKP